MQHGGVDDEDVEIGEQLPRAFSMWAARMRIDLGALQAAEVTMSVGVAVPMSVTTVAFVVFVTVLMSENSAVCGARLG
jgi:hypothetical protein